MAVSRATDAKPGTVGVVMVTYRPGPVVEAAVDAIDTDDVTAIVVIDNSPNGSPDLDRAVRAHPRVAVTPRTDNPGFCAGNNIGLALLPATEFVLFLNPDAVVEAGFATRAVAAMRAHPTAGALNPKLVQLDGETLQRTGLIDCAGVDRRWFGRTYDRGQGLADDGRFDAAVAEVPALCGAALFCRRSALDEVAPDGQVFDESFFMYKEDIDLSYRLRRMGWKLLFDPQLVAGHVRGARSVAEDPARRVQLRTRSLANDWRIWHKGLVPVQVRVPMFGYLIAKTVAVRMLRWTSR